jgi:probable rRNA maturation factor
MILTISATAGRSHASLLARRVRRARPLIRCHLAELSVALVGDARMAALHEQFLGIPDPTDVLTFELEHDARGRVTAGEVVICVPEARRQARLHKHPVERELLLYAIHGMLHLAGFDDRTPADYTAMHAMEDRILGKLGIGPVFASGTPAARRRGGRKC